MLKVHFISIIIHDVHNRLHLGGEVASLLCSDNPAAPVQHVRCVAAGGHHTVAVTDTTVCAWGANNCGQLGTRTFKDKAAPTDIKELEQAGVASVACGAHHTLFLCK